MKKSLLALAVLGAFAGAASAQSSVTLYGRVDLSLARNIGFEATGTPKLAGIEMQNGSGSRLGVRGVEDLGGGLKAFFNIEHRFNADTGTNPNARFWHGRSLVGVEGGFGKISLGREYTPAFLMSQLVADPWGWDTVSANNLSTGGGIAPVRADNSITYNFAAAGFSVGAQVALKESGDKNGFSLAGQYAAGPLVIGAGYDRPVNSNDTNWTTINGSFDLGMVKLGGLFGTGKLNDQKRRSWLLTATAPIGGGELRAAYGELKTRNPSVKLSRQFSLGYHYALSKRTTVYADIVNDGKRVDVAAAGRDLDPNLSTRKTGFDVGIKHNF
jgi:predicted porin